MNLILRCFKMVKKCTECIQNKIKFGKHTKIILNFISIYSKQNIHCELHFVLSNT